MNEKAKRDISHKLRILEHTKNTGNIAKTCRYFGISRDSFYTWRKAYDKFGEAGLINNKPCPEDPNLLVDIVIEEKIIYLRTNYHFGPLTISCYLERFHDIKVSRSGVTLLLRNGLNRLPENTKKRSKLALPYLKSLYPIPCKGLS